MKPPDGRVKLEEFSFNRGYCCYSFVGAKEIGYIYIYIYILEEPPPARRIVKGKFMWVLAQKLI